jgi:arylsulfatase A-like enzyme
MKAGLAAGGAVALASLAELAIHRARDQAPDLLPVLGAITLLAAVVGVVALVVARIAPLWLAIALATAGPLLWIAHSLVSALGGGPVVANVAGIAAALLAGAAGNHAFGAPLLGVAAALTLAASAIASLPDPPEPSPGAERRTPDIVLLVLDTTRRDRLSLYGHARDTTPALDALAQQARVYDDAWASAPWTSPSHASLFTGLLPAEHGADGRDAVPLPSGLETLSTVLRRAGYRTGGFAANPNLHSAGWSEGFDRYEPPWLRGAHSLVPLLNDWLRGADDPWLQHDATTRVLAAARRWWAEDDGAPRYLFLNVLDPHNPYWAPAPDRARFAGESGCEHARDLMSDARIFYRESDLSDADASCLASLYDAELFAMDRALGEFFDWLAERGELDRTLIAVTSDHGERLGERGRLGHLLLMDQHLLRVPLFVRHPPTLAPERVTARVQLVGLPAFLLATAGLTVPETMARRSFERQAGSPAVAQHQHFGWYIDRIRRADPDFDPTPYRGDWNFVAADDYALLWTPDQGPESARLIDYRADPDLAHDLSDRLPQVTERLRALAASLPRFAGSATPETPPVDRELRRRLEALGYADPDTP